MAETNSQIDYTPALNALNAELGEIRDHLGTLAEHSSHQRAVMDRFMIIFERAGDLERGLITAPANDDGFNDAAMIVALRDAGRLDAVRAEQSESD